MKLQRWEQSCQDCRRALDMDQSLVKGHFFLGQGLVELECYDEAIKHLQRGNFYTLTYHIVVFSQIYSSIGLISACDLAKEQKRNFSDDIAMQLRTARKKRWNVQEERRICQEIELQSYLNKLINDDMENRISNIKLDDTKNEAVITKEVAEVEEECENHMTELNNLFAKVDDRRRVSIFSVFKTGLCLHLRLEFALKLLIASTISET